MEEPTVADGGAQANGQRHKIRNSHRLGVPARQRCKPPAAGLTTAIPGINSRQYCDAAVKNRRKADVTTAYSNAGNPGFATEGVYAPQQDSHLLIDVMDRAGLLPGRRVVDLCTGSGVVAIGAAERGAAAVTAFDICPRAVRCARANALAVGVDVDVHVGSWTRAIEFGTYDVVVCNPPYVPHAPDDDIDDIPAHLGPAWAWDAGPDGRLVLDPLCTSASGLLDGGGTMLVVQSEFSGVERSLEALRDVGLIAEVVAEQWIPFGPILSARAKWFERMGWLQHGRRDEKLVVIRADKP
jgi:release factor glutamine methyltransferase